MMYCTNSVSDQSSTVSPQCLTLALESRIDGRHITLRERARIRRAARPDCTGRA